ncbi:MAG: hypothetical protein N3D16_12075, partial [Anaerolineales bacterium]|nr:hypothetical protein [Anaerolineales bacterium]
VYFVIIGFPLITSVVIIMVTLQILIQPWRLWFGIENSEAFVERILPPYRTMKIMNKLLPAGSTVLFIWEGRGYYCIHHCIADTEPSNWIRLVTEAEWKSEKVCDLLRERQIRYFLLNRQEINRMQFHDPNQLRNRANRFLMFEFLPNYAKVNEQDSYSSLFELICDDQ